ncbi:STE3-like pheromone receptor B mating type [Gelatoporia subvermispora B]|uniref:STE3-like pheromone receptor B mating type n=1 Tax=Ceriporiopsis subvermispora (strain B) TaxID=914234 RepID=M2PGN9_CERS8|nr:STE3-like pheromone receptor B mating type [Gelatoporia subvermispora B]
MSVPWSVQQDIYIFFAFLGAVLVSIPLYWHLEAWNVGCVLYIFWCGTQCLIQGINMLIWKNNAINWAPVWCDITSRWMLASGVGVCACSLIINRRLYKIASVSAVSSTRQEKRRMIITDLCIGLGIPILQVALYWFVQGHRFDIYEGIGCFFAMPNTIPAFFLSDCWPVVIGMISLVYCSLTLRAFYKRRKQCAEFIRTNSNLTFNRYLRLMILASVEIICTIPLGAYTIWVNASQPLYKWRGLADIHFDFSRVGQYPAIIWQASPITVSSFNFNNWIIVACALLFFALFGVAEEARKHYRMAASSVAKRVGISTASWGQSRSAGTGWGNTSGSKPVFNVSNLAKVTLPSFVQRGRRGSIASFSDRLSTQLSLSIGDMGADDFKTPHSPLDEKAPYSPSSSSGSSTYLPSPVDEKAEVSVSVVSAVPAVAPRPLTPPPRAVVRTAPDVPASVRPNSIDMV